MSNPTGRQVAYGLSLEANKGTAESTVDYWIDQSDGTSLYEQNEKIMDDSAVGIPVKYSGSASGQSSSKGTIAANVTDESFGLILLAALGKVTDAANSDSSGTVYDHTFSFATDNVGKSLTLFKTDGVTNQAFPMAMIDQLEIDHELGKFISYKADFLCDIPSTASVTASRIVENNFTAKHATIKLASTLSGLSVADTLATVQSLKLTVKKNATLDFQDGQNNPYDITFADIEITGDLVLRYSSIDQYNNYLDNTESAVELALVNDDVTIGTSANPSIIITLPKVTFTDWSLSDSLGDKLEQTIGFSAVYSKADSSFGSVVLTNTVASY